MLRIAVVGLLAVLLTVSAQAGGKASGKVKPSVAPKPSEAETCGEFGTSVHFEKTPTDAARKALKEEKLVFVLHVSGDFEDSEFT